MMLIDADKLHLKLLDIEFPIQDQDPILDAMDDCTVDAAPVVHGRWVGESVVIYSPCLNTELRECSHCHKVSTIDEYCSVCGTKMDFPEDVE